MNNSLLARRHLILAFLLLIFNGLALAANTEVQLSSDIPAENGIAPFDVLAAQLKKDKTSTRFRVKYEMVASGGDFGGTLVYNRKKRFIKIYDYNHFYDDYDRNQYLISQVSDADIIRYVQRHKVKHQKEGFYAFFSVFRFFGCKTFRLEHRHIGPNDSGWPDIKDRVTKKS